MKILFPNSNWASNIGNPFFTLGARHLLSKAMPNVELLDTASNAAVPYGLKGSAYKNSFVYANYLGDVDAVLLCGPIFDKNFSRLYGGLLEEAQNAGIKVLFLTVGGMTYEQDEIAHCREVLKRYPPAMLATRDQQTFENYGDLCPQSYSGICTAWFSPDGYPGYDTPRLGKYLTITNDFGVEPNATQVMQAINGAARIENKQTKVGLLRKVFFALDRSNNSVVGDHTIVRPQHRLIRHKSLLFRNPNSFCAFTPQGYLNIYRNTELTITDRLHAAVATLSYGNPAYLFLRSKRTHLLEAVGLKYEAGKRLMIDAELLQKKKNEYISWLAKTHEFMSQ